MTAVARAGRHSAAADAKTESGSSADGWLVPAAAVRRRLAYAATRQRLAARGTAAQRLTAPGQVLRLRGETAAARPEAGGAAAARPGSAVLRDRETACARAAGGSEQGTAGVTGARRSTETHLTAEMLISPLGG